MIYLPAHRRVYLFSVLKQRNNFRNYPESGPPTGKELAGFREKSKDSLNNPEADDESGEGNQHRRKRRDVSANSSLNVPDKGSRK